MSLVFITQHNENIYDIVQRKTAEDLKPIFPKTKARKSAKLSKPDKERIEPNTFILSSTDKYHHKTMGYAETPLHAPDDYLRKNEGVKWKRKTDHKCIHKELPPIPDFDPCAKPPERFERDFKMKNIKAVVCKPPRRSIPKYAISRTGDVRILCESGIMPAYIFHPNYGKVPKYLIASKKAKAQIEMERKQKEMKEDFRLISPEERQELLNGLKANWLELQKKFQLLPVLTDTEPKKKRKFELEKDIRQLENDILLVESNPLIYVCADDGSEETTGIKLGYRKPKQPFTKDISTDVCLRR